MQINEVGIEKRYLELLDTLRHAQVMYHVFKEPIMNDMRYDFLVKELRETIKFRPDLKDKIPQARPLPEQILTCGKFTRHDYPMLRLNRKYDISGLVNWLKILPKGAKVDITTKVTGIAVELIYVEGKLHKAITKGEGLIGRDVTLNLYCIKGVPDTINLPGRTNIRGMVTSETLVVNSQGEVTRPNGLELKTYVTEQLMKPVPDHGFRDIMFNAYSMDNQSLDYKTWDDWDTKLRIHGFRPVKRYGSSHAADIYEFGHWEEILDRIKLRIENSAYLPTFSGLVFAVSEMEHRYELGYTSRFPEWAIAYTPDKDFTNVTPEATQRTL